MRIVFFHQGSPCHGHTLKNKPLGGTESALISMAKALRVRDHSVTVFNEADQEGSFDGVEYRHWKDFEAYSHRHSFDVFISVRTLLPIMARRFAPVQIYFSPDAYDQPFLNRAFELLLTQENVHYKVGLYSLKQISKYADAIFCVGHWQAQTLIDRFSVPADKVFVAYNGVELSEFCSSPLNQRQPQLVYASTPFRGLEFLLKYFPEIKKQVPKAQCAILSGMQLYGMSLEEDRKHYGQLYQLANQPGVTLYGPLPKPKMAEIFSQSRLMAYPNTFAETFCIAVLEAQASGLPIVTTDLAGLKERVTNGEDGFLISGHPAHESYQQVFIQRTVQLLTDDALWNRMSEKGQMKAQAFSYDRLALYWEEKLSVLLEQSALNPKHHPFQVQAQEFCITAQGYPKKINLSQAMITRHYAEVLRQSGFPRVAEEALATDVTRFC